MANSSKQSYVKKVLVDEAELERLQQRQLRDYSPELASLSRLKADMDSILRRSGLSPQEKLTRLSAVHGRFEKIRKDTGVLSCSSSSAPQVAANHDAQQPPTIDDNSTGDEENEVEAGDTEEEEVILEPLSPTSTKCEIWG